MITESSTGFWMHTCCKTVSHQAAKLKRARLAALAFTIVTKMKCSLEAFIVLK